MRRKRERVPFESVPNRRSQLCVQVVVESTPLNTPHEYSLWLQVEVRFYSTQPEYVFVFARFQSSSDLMVGPAQGVGGFVARFSGAYVSENRALRALGRAVGNSRLGRVAMTLGASTLYCELHARKKRLGTNVRKRQNSIHT
jgi:hypothetical protein